MPALSIEVRDDVAVVTFDQPGAPVNVFTAAVRDEFAALLDRLDHDEGVRAAVLLSGKPDTWIAGADIEELAELRMAADGERLSERGHLLMDRVERLRTPLVAAINGACLGGGLELALACAYRIATETPKTVLALPEVELGLIPGAGGTQRLPRTVGLREALDMILTGRKVRPRRALQSGLVDEVVHPAILRDIAIQRAHALVTAGGRDRLLRSPPVKLRSRTGTVQRILLDENPAGRAVVFRQAREQMMARSRGNYPAPAAALQAVESGYHGNRDRGFATEARLFGEMAVTDVARQLVFLYFAAAGPGPWAINQK